MSVDFGDQLEIGGEFESLGAPRLDSVVAPHLCHRAAADPKMRASSRDFLCVTPYLLGDGATSVIEIRLSRSRVRGRPERSSSDLTYPPSPERRTAGREVWSRVHDGRSPPAGPAKGRRRNGGPTVPPTTCSAAAAHSWWSAPCCDRHWPTGRKTNSSLLPSQSNRLRSHADRNHPMSETQRTAIDIARDHAHSQQILVSYPTKLVRPE